MLTAAVVSVAAIYLTGHWIGGLAVAVLIWVWWFLRPSAGPPILALALSFQWMQITLGIFYTAATGDVLPAFISTDWQRMVLVGLGCVVFLALGLRLGVSLVRRPAEDGDDKREFVCTLPMLWAVYGASVVSTGAIQEVAWNFPAFTQAILAINFAHLALVYLLLRRYSQPHFQWQYIAGLVAFEVGLGFTGYFADFREPLIMAIITITEIFDRQRASHWLITATVVVVLGVSGFAWMSVRDQYRQDFTDELATASRADRLARVQSLLDGVNIGDRQTLRNTGFALADRLWAIYYPARALERVPAFQAHEDGRIIMSALIHLVTPRVLFPDKGELPSDSEMVRKYSDVNVAGAEQNTSIAFGYAAESYVDFGIPLMFVPVFLYGMLAGVSYQGMLQVLRHRELAISVITVIFWLSLYLFERSWVKTLGTHLTLLVYLGGLTYLLDKYLSGREAPVTGELPSETVFDQGA